MASKKKLKRKIKKLKAQGERMKAELEYWKNRPHKTIYVMPGESIADAIDEPIVEETTLTFSGAFPRIMT